MFLIRSVTTNSVCSSCWQANVSFWLRSSVSQFIWMTNYHSCNLDILQDIFYVVGDVRPLNFASVCHFLWHLGQLPVIKLLGQALLFSPLPVFWDHYLFLRLISYVSVEASDIIVLHFGLTFTSWTASGREHSHQSMIWFDHCLATIPQNLQDLLPSTIPSNTVLINLLSSILQMSLKSFVKCTTSRVVIQWNHYSSSSSSSLVIYSVLHT